MSAAPRVIRDATVYDGTGSAPRRADLVLVGSRIQSLRPPGAAAGRTVLDAQGLAVCPGFIDIHGHSDMALTHPAAPEILSPFLLQGVTTQVIGNCGIGVAPAPRERQPELAAFMSLIVPEAADWSWETFAEYLRTLESRPLPFNVASLAAHGALRCATAGAEPGPARPGMIDAMRNHLAEALAAGAFGLSAGLIYPPGMWSDTDELVSLADRVAAADGIFACHVRGSSELAVESVRELLEIGQRTGVRLQHSHHEAFGPGFWHLAARTMAMEQAARDAGLDVASDVIPYHAVNTTLMAIYPPWALAGGVQALCGRLADEKQRARIDSAIHGFEPQWPPWDDGWAHNLVLAGGWDNIVLLQAASTAHAGWLGHSLTEIAEREGRSPFDCAAQVTRASHGNVLARYHAISGTADDDGVLHDLLTHPRHALAIDVILKGEGVSHPGGHGAIPRLLGHYARDQGWLGLAEAIRKGTSLPAERIGIRGRGRIAPGFAADLVVFAPDKIAEQGTWQRPDRPPTGIHAVFVNGKRAVRERTIIDGAAGKVLRRGPGLGSR